MHAKLLILEGSWAEQSDDYISDSLSTTRVYNALEALLWIHGTPIRVVQRPLLAARFVDDLSQFVSLEANRNGVNVVILTAHGKKTSKPKPNSRHRLHRRVLSGIDGPLDLSAKIQKLNRHLSRTILIVDSCRVGADLTSLLRASGALGIVGFSADVDWIDSSAFVLAVLLKFHQEGVFIRKRKPAALKAALGVLQDMKTGSFKSLWKELGTQVEFSGRK